MSNLELIKQYNSAREALGKMFDVDEMWYNVIDETESRWTDYGNKTGNEISYGYSTDEIEDGSNFGVYGTSRWKSNCGEFVLFVGDDCSGNRDMYLFSSALCDDL